ncbi:MAG TPA: hypothetical protein VJP04_11995 [Terriglobales bacterium]|jgi:hypothetical protein|nr:hypothetical protein [Terriglobales bacterium]
MSFAIAVPARLSEWGWLFGFALVSLALVGLAVLADAVYEGYRERISRGHRPPTKATGDGGEQGFSGQADDAGVPRKKAA